MSYPAIHDWSIGRDETDPTTFTYLEGGARVSLTGCTISLEIRWEGDGGGIVLTAGIAPEIVIEDQADPMSKGRLTINLSPAQRAQIPMGRAAKYQIRRTADGISVIDIHGDVVAISRVGGNG